MSTPAWVLAKLDARAHEVASADAGSGSNRPAAAALYKAAFALGQLCPHLLDRGTITQRLLRAATHDRAQPLRPSDAERDLAKGLDEGMRQPWHPTSKKASMSTKSTKSTPRPRTETSQEPPPQREVVALWNACRPVAEDPAARAWLESHRIDPERVAADNLALALPSEGLPGWARAHLEGRMQSWAESGHRLVLPLVDVQGQLRTVLARDLTGRHREKKSLSPLGHARRGLFLRCPAARTALWPDRVREPVAELASPAWHTDAPTRRLVVVEGEKKYLRAATLASDADPHAPGVIGIVSGSWSDDLAALIPNGWRVRVDVDPDGEPDGPKASGGALYATKILRSLDARWTAGFVAVALGKEWLVERTDRGLVARVKPERAA